MVTPDLLEYLREHLVKRLSHGVTELTEAEARAWFDALLESWFLGHNLDAEHDTPAGEGTQPHAESSSPLEIQFETDAGRERSTETGEVPTYDPPPLREGRTASLVQLWMQTAYVPWPDRLLERATKVFASRLVYSVPQPPLTYEICQLGWAHINETEAGGLVFELHRAGVDIEALLAQIEAFPYPEISLGWFTEPEHSLWLHASLIVRMGEALRTTDPASATRLKHNIDFVGRLTDLIPPHVRTWLQGWHAACEHIAFARAVGLDPDAE